jgi:uncharacterized membrane protein
MCISQRSFRWRHLIEINILTYLSMRLYIICKVSTHTTLTWVLPLFKFLFWMVLTITLEERVMQDLRRCDGWSHMWERVKSTISNVWRLSAIEVNNGMLPIMIVLIMFQTSYSLRWNVSTILPVISIYMNRQILVWTNVMKLDRILLLNLGLLIHLLK